MINNFPRIAMLTLIGLIIWPMANIVNSYGSNNEGLFELKSESELMAVDKAIKSNRVKSPMLHKCG